MTSKRSLTQSSSTKLGLGVRYGLASLLLAGTVVATGCLDRPVGISRPVTTNVVVQKQANNAITGIDLLLMIDNSSSMADKQATLAAAVPQLLGQLVQPNCVDGAGASLNPPVAASLGAAQPCPTNSSPEFNPVNNIHIGIVTSSLGDHGANTLCTPGLATQYTDPATSQPILQPADVNDMGRLAGTFTRASAAQADAQTTFATLSSSGFLAWGNSDLPTGVGQADLTAANKIFTDMVAAVHEVGCGYESSLEGWFRFLIDPVPPVYPLAAPDAQSFTHRTGSDDVVLNQRAAFLRPDSLVAIVMLTDENDCSIRDTDVGWVSAKTDTSITSGSTKCAENPNDKCCYSCTVSGPPGGCANGCAGAGPAVDDGTYQANIRCWQQKRRFGYEFLYPKSRYVVGLTKKELCPDQSFGDMDCDCEYANSIGASCNPGGRRMPNPLYSTVVGTLNNNQAIVGYPNAIARSDNSAIFLAGIVGVPWQDIGVTDANGVLSYIPVTDPAWTDSAATSATAPNNVPTNGAKNIWDMIYGDDNANVQPKDIHMVESVVPRAGLPAPTAAVNADPFNGHEYNTAREDLEYACIYALPQSRPCDCTAGTTFASCKYQHPNDCCDLTYPSDGAGGPGADFDKPLCQNPAGGAPQATQYSAKGYPGLREIAVLHDYALSPNALTLGNSIVASICPKDLASAATSPGYGYNPAVAALINRLKEKLKGSCLPRPLTVNPDGTLPCAIVEVVPASSLKDSSGNVLDCTTYCTNMGRDVPSPSNPDGPPNPQMTQAVTASMQQSRICDAGTGSPACSSMCLCALAQETGGNLGICQNATDGTENTAIPAGYCYVDPANGAGTNLDVVAKCPETQRRILRFAGNNPSGGGHPVPLPGSFVFTACQGSALGAAAATATPAADAGP